MQRQNVIESGHATGSPGEGPAAYLSTRSLDRLLSYIPTLGEEVSGACLLACLHAFLRATWGALQRSLLSSFESPFINC